MKPLIAEYAGTLIMILLGNGVVANVVLKDTKGNGANWIVITTGWAMAVFAGVIVAGPHSGAHLNPAVTLSLACAGKFDWALLPVYALAQMLGAMSGAFLVWNFYRDHFRRTEEENLKAACFFTAPAISNKGRNLFSEVTGAFVLIFVIFHFTDASVADSGSVIGLGSVGALPVAFLVWAIGLSLGGTTGYAINPARDLGPRIVYHFLMRKNSSTTHWAYSWIPVTGPLLGAVLASVLFGWLSGF